MTAKNLPAISTGTSSPSVLGGSEAGAAGGSSQGFDWNDAIFIGPTPEEIQRKKKADAIERHKRRVAAMLAEKKAAQLPDDQPEQNEAALLGILLSQDDGRAFDAMHAAGLRPEHFTTPHGAVIVEILALHKAGIPIDLVTVSGHLTNGAMETAGGKIGLNRLVDVAPPVSHAGHYAGRIAEAALKRTLAAEAQEWLTLAQNGTNSAELIPKIRAALDRAEAAKPAGRPQAFSLVELAEQSIDAEETLIGLRGCRWVERGAIVLLAAPAGIGKSHVVKQAGACWSCGRSAFGLPPYNGPLRILTVQAENPPNDERAMSRNILAALQLTSEERTLVSANTRTVWMPGTTGDAFLRELSGYLRSWQADLVFIDPLAGFASGDLVKPEVVQSFCRSGLGRIAVENRVALFVMHHVPKPNANRDPSKMGTYDHQYSGAGSADLVANWPRAVLTLQPLPTRGEFLLRAAKRRPPWENPDGSQAWEMGIKHSPLGLWETFTPDPASTRTGGRPNSPDPETYRAAVLDLVAKTGPLSKSAMEDRIRSVITGTRPPARAILERLLLDVSLVTWRGTGKGGPMMVGLQKDRPAMEGG